MKVLTIVFLIASPFFSIGYSLASTPAEKDTVEVIQKAQAIAEVLPMSGAFALSSDGKRAAHINPEGDAVIWDAVKLEQRELIPLKDMPATAVALNSDGSKLATGHGNNKIILWSVQDKTKLRELNGHFSRISSLAFSPDGKLLASGSSDATAALWELKTGNRLHSFDLHLNYDGDAYGEPVGLHFSDQGKALIVSEWLPSQYDRERKASIWDLQTGLSISSLSFSPPNYGDLPVSGLALGGHGVLLAVSEQESLTIRRLDQCDGEQKTVPSGRYAETVAVDPLGRWVAYETNRSLSFVSASQPEKIYKLELPGTTLKMLPIYDGSSIVVLVGKVDPANKEPILFGSNAGKNEAGVLYKIQVPEPVMQSPAISANPKPLCIPDNERQPPQLQITKNPIELKAMSRLVPTADMIGTSIDETPVPAPPVSDLFFNSNNVLYAYYPLITHGDGNETKTGVVAWNIFTQKQRESRMRDYPGSLMNWRLPDGWAEGQPVISHSVTGEVLCQYDGNETRPEHVAIDPDTGSIFVVNRTTGYIEHCSPDGNVTLHLQTKGPIHAITARNRRLAAAYGGSQFQVWEVDPYVIFPIYQHQVLNYLPDNDEMGGTVEVDNLELSPDGQYLRIDVSSPDAPVRTDIFNAQTGEKISNASQITRFQSETSLIATDTERGHQVAIWNLLYKQKIAVVPTGWKNDGFRDDALPNASISNDGHYLLTADTGAPVLLWDLEENKLLGSIHVNNRITSLAFDNTGNKFAIGMESGEIEVFQVPGRKGSKAGQGDGASTLGPVSNRFKKERGIYVTGSSINVRKLPNVQDKVVATLPIGARVLFQGDTKNHSSQCRDEGLDIADTIDWLCFSTPALQYDPSGEWTHFWAVSNLFSQDKPKLKDLIEKFDFAAPENTLERKKWAERAVALNPTSSEAQQRLVQVLKELDETEALTEGEELFSRYQARKPPEEDGRKLIFIYDGSFIEPFAEIVGNEIKPWTVASYDYNLRPKFTNENQTFHRRGEFYHLYSGGSGRVGTLATVMQFNCALNQCLESVPVRYLDAKHYDQAGPGDVATNFLLSEVDKDSLEITSKERETITLMLKAEIDSHNSEKEKKLLLKEISSNSHVAMARQLASSEKKILIGSVTVGSENDERYGEEESYATFLVIAEEQDDGSFIKAESPSAKELEQIGCAFNSALDLNSDGTDEVLLQCDRLEGSYIYSLLRRTDNGWGIEFQN